jgi:hypothetical protein
VVLTSSFGTVQAVADRAADRHWRRPVGMGVQFGKMVGTPKEQPVEQVKPETYRLTSKGQPSNLSNGQELCLYQVMAADLNGGPATMDQIVKQAEYRKYQYFLKAETSVERSIRHHFKKWLAEKWIEQV